MPPATFAALPSIHGSASVPSSPASPSTPQQKSYAASPIVLGRDTPILIKVQDGATLGPAIWISVFALLVSLINPLLSWSKDKKARKQSINDEFWLRKVLFPAAIEPLLEFFAACIKDLPEDRFSARATSSRVAEFHEKFTDEHHALSRKLVTVGILNHELYLSLQSEFEALEDSVTAYCHANKSGYEPNATDSNFRRTTVESDVSTCRLNMFKAIKSMQEKIE